MSEYQAKSKNSIVFDVTKEDSQTGKLSYTSWFKFDALIELPDNINYEVKPKGFWGTTVEVKDGENVLLKFKMNWNGQIIVETFFRFPGEDYVFKHQGVFKEIFVFVDRYGTELLVMKPVLKWTAMGFEYQITTSDAFESIAKKEVLLLTLIHCANYYMSMMMSS